MRNSALLLSCFAAFLSAQELQPRAYIPAPVGLNYFGVSYAHNAGALLFDPSLPVTNADVSANIVTLAFGQTWGVLGRTAQTLLVMPYAEGTLDGSLPSAQQHAYRSGLGDLTFRYAMNIYGAPAMNRKEFAAYRQKTIVGASLTMFIPTGQYDQNKLVDIGENRWGFKPELGISRAFGEWTLEGAAGVWFYTANNQFEGNAVRTQDPLGSLQVHLIRNLPHQTWLASDWTYYTGGRTEVSGRDNADYIGNARCGATFGFTLGARQAIKIIWFDGFLNRSGAATHSEGISYNIIWQKGR